MEIVELDPVSVYDLSELSLEDKAACLNFLHPPVMLKLMDKDDDDGMTSCIFDEDDIVGVVEVPFSEVWFPRADHVCKATRINKQTYRRTHIQAHTYKHAQTRVQTPSCAYARTCATEPWANYIINRSS